MCDGGGRGECVCVLWGGGVHFILCKNKGADQLHMDSEIPLLLKSEIPSF